MKYFILFSLACLPSLAQAQSISGYTFIDLNALSETQGRTLALDAVTLQGGARVDFGDLGVLNSALSGLNLTVSVTNAALVTSQESSDPFSIPRSMDLTGSDIMGSFVTLWSNPGQTATITYGFSRPTASIFPMDVALVTGGTIDPFETNRFGNPDSSRGFLFDPPTNPGLTVTGNSVGNSTDQIIITNTGGPAWLGRSLVPQSWQTDVINANPDLSGAQLGANQYLYVAIAPEPSSLLLLALGSLGLLRRRR